MATSIPLSWAATPGTGRIVIRAGRVFDGISPDYLRRREIVIENNLIVAIRPWTDRPAGGGGDVAYIDASELTVMPGLIDLGVQQAPSNLESAGRAWLAAGITSIREVVSDTPRAIEQWESWRSGRRAGPRLHMALRACDKAVGDMLTDPSGTLPTPLAALALVETCGPNDAALIEKTVAAIHARGIAATARDPFPAILLGIDEVSLPGARFGPGGARRELAGAVYNDIIDIVAERQLGLVTNLGRYAPGSRRRQVEQQLFRIIGRGGRVATGSGAPASAPRGTGLHDELKRLLATGLQPFQVLKMATLEAARMLGRDAELGSIQPGKLADLVLVQGDPLADIGEVANVVTVVIDGQALGRRSLKRPGLRRGTVEKLYN